MVAPSPAKLAVQGLPGEPLLSHMVVGGGERGLPCVFPEQSGQGYARQGSTRGCTGQRQSPPPPRQAPPSPTSTDWSLQQERSFTRDMFSASRTGSPEVPGKRQGGVGLRRQVAQRWGRGTGTSLLFSGKTFLLAVWLPQERTLDCQHAVDTPVRLLFLGGGG